MNRAHNLSVLLGPVSMVKEEGERRKECLEYLGIYGYISQGQSGGDVAMDMETAGGAAPPW